MTKRKRWKRLYPHVLRKFMKGETIVKGKKESAKREKRKKQDSDIKEGRQREAYNS